MEEEGDTFLHPLFLTYYKTRYGIYHKDGVFVPGDDPPAIDARLQGPEPGIPVRAPGHGGRARVVPHPFALASLPLKRVHFETLNHLNYILISVR
jgi:hypothetical protein